MTTISKLGQKLRDPEYRRAFVASQINIGIPFQLRALLKSRGKTQEWLAEKSGMLQPRISGLMTPGKTRPNIETLRRIAEAFDCGLMVRLAPFSELAKWSDAFDPESFSVPDFEHDTGFIEKKPHDTAVTLGGSSTLPRTEQGPLAATQDRSIDNLIFMDKPKRGLQVLAEPKPSGLAVLRVV